MGESIIEGTAFGKKKLQVGESVSHMGIWRKRICAEGVSGAKTMKESMCPLLGKLGYWVWGMQSETESDGGEVRDLTEN